MVVATVAEPRFGALLAGLREARGWHRSILAEKAGLSYQSIRRYERDEHTPDRAAITKLAEVLGRHTLRPLLEAAGYPTEDIAEAGEAPPVRPTPASADSTRHTARSTRTPTHRRPATPAVRVGCAGRGLRTPPNRTAPRSGIAGGSWYPVAPLSPSRLPPSRRRYRPLQPPQRQLESLSALIACRSTLHIRTPVQIVVRYRPPARPDLLAAAPAPLGLSLLWPRLPNVRHRYATASIASTISRSWVLTRSRRSAAA